MVTLLSPWPLRQQPVSQLGGKCVSDLQGVSSFAGVHTSNGLGSIRGGWPELVRAGQTKFSEAIGTIKDVSNLDAELACS